MRLFVISDLKTVDTLVQSTQFFGDISYLVADMQDVHKVDMHS